MTHYFCSTFSREYVYKGLLLYQSLLRWDDDFHFFMVCLHDEAKELLERMSLEKATILSLSEVEFKDAPLAGVKKLRSDKEYIWSSKASVMLYILESFPHIDHVVWLDGDTCFCSDPAPIFAEWGKASILLTEERWRRSEAHKVNHFGRYNTGFMGFKNNTDAIRCLQWFRKRLLAWCYDRHENNLWSDQLYVNDWLTRFRNVGVVKSKGINVTPYYIQECKVTRKDEAVYIDGDRLVLFHFYGFRPYDGNEFDLCRYRLSLPDKVIKEIYMPYLHACNEVLKQISKVDRTFYLVTKPKDQYIQNYFNLSANISAEEKMPNICTILTKDYLVQGLTLYSSLKRHTPRFQFWVLCVDQLTYDLLERLQLENVHLVSVQTMATRKLTRLKSKRQLHEFCWTLKSSFLSYVIKNNFNVDSVLYMDADLFFYQDCREIYDDWGESSVYLTKLWLPPSWEKKVGKYSAGLIGIKRDKSGRATLESWRRKCLHWCYDRREKGLWADQKYLDAWPQVASGVRISANVGINAGPWNIKRNYAVDEKEGSLRFGSRKLVCYHFSGFRILSENEFVLCNRKKLPGKAEPIYAVYLYYLQQSMNQLKSIDNDVIGKITGV